MMSNKYLFLFGLLTISSVTNGFTSKDVKCHVCKATIQEMEEEIAKVDPNKKADISGFRLDASGNSVGKSVTLAKSEMYLTELMENICDKMDDYVKATYKSNGRLTVLKMIIDGKMNPETSNVDFVQDGDLNKSLKHFCLEILEDHEESFIKAFQADVVGTDLDIKICTEQARYCNDAPLQDDYQFDEVREDL
ncbi:protein seele [Teleopsis dalmanni]|uniref:protein seele n=1 Tax=Teleopsis dalmanni TaxID=139649 RepID=UPI0018CCB460|nr:protein seele [Teleopsis dalmanni]